MTESAPVRDNWLIVVAMTSCQAMVLFDIAAVGVALPEMTRDLGLAPSSASWVVNAYLLTYASFVALGGRLADERNHYRMYLWGAVVFLAASSVCGLTPVLSGVSEPWLIGFRAVQGIGGALMVPAALAIVTQSVRPEARGRAMSVYIGGGQLFFILAPLISGVLTQQASWRAIFFVVVPIGLTAILILVTAERSRFAGRMPAPARTAATSTILLVLGLALAVLGLDEAGRNGWGSPFPVLQIVLGLGVLAAFVVLERRSQRPVLPFALFAGSKFTRYLLVLFFLQTATVSLITFGPVVLQHQFSLTPSRAGLTMLAFIAGWVAMVPVAGILNDRYGSRLPVTAGAALAFVSLCGWTWSLTGLPVSGQIPFMVLTGLGIGLSILPANTACVSAGDVGHRAATVGLVQTIRQLGGVIAIALLGPLFLTGDTGAAGLSMAKAGYLILVVAVAANMLVAASGWLPGKTGDAD